MTPKPKFTPSHPSAPWRVYHDGRSFWFTTEADAKKRCDELAAHRFSGTFTTRELDEFRRCKELMQGVPLITAVRAFLEQGTFEAITLSEAIARHLTAATGRPEYLEKKRYHLAMLEAQFGQMQVNALQPAHIEQALAKMKSDWVKNNYLTHIRILFRYLVRLRIMRSDPSGPFQPVRVKASKVILTLDDADHLMKTCAESPYATLLPAIAFQLYLGIRTSEVCRLDWSAVRVGEFVDIEDEVSKTHERRVIDWWPAKLSQYVRKQGSGSVVVYPKSYEAHKHRLIELCRGTKKDFNFAQNALRHSFGSYATAYFQNAGRVALLMGQRDINILFRHYRSYRTHEEACTFFAEPALISGRKTSRPARSPKESAQSQ